MWLTIAEKCKQHVDFTHGLSDSWLNTQFTMLFSLATHQQRNVSQLLSSNFSLEFHCFVWCNVRVISVNRQNVAIRDWKTLTSGNAQVLLHVNFPSMNYGADLMICTAWRLDPPPPHPTHPMVQNFTHLSAKCILFRSIYGHTLAWHT